jgi:hypothetical protein
VSKCLRYRSFANAAFIFQTTFLHPGGYYTTNSQTQTILSQKETSVLNQRYCVTVFSEGCVEILDLLQYQIKWLFIFLSPVQETFTHMETSPLPVESCKFGAYSLWARRNLYRATPAWTRYLGFCGLDQMTAPFIRGGSRDFSKGEFYQCILNGSTSTCWILLLLHKELFCSDTLNDIIFTHWMIVLLHFRSLILPWVNRAPNIYQKDRWKSCRPRLLQTV